MGNDRNGMEADLYTTLDADRGHKMIYKMARHRNEYSNDVTGGTFIKDRKMNLDKTQVVWVARQRRS